MICHLFHALAGHNWTPVASADVSAKYISPQNGDDIPVDVDSIFFTYDPAAAAAPPYSAPPPHKEPYPQPYIWPHSLKTPESNV